MPQAPTTKPSTITSTINGRSVDQNPAAIYIAGLSAGSRRTMIGALNAITGLMGMAADETGVSDCRYLVFPWYELRYAHTSAIRTALGEQYSYSTANKMLSALRGVLREAWRLGLMPAETYQRTVDIKNLTGESVPAGRSLKAGELAGLLATCRPTLLGVRDAAIIALLYTGGLRRAELVNISLADYDPDEKMIKVKGKRNKERLVHIPDGAVSALGDWLAVRGLEGEAMFTGVGNRNKGGKLTTQAIYAMLKKRTKQAGLPNLSPHDFRRTYVGDLLDVGVDISTVQKMAGHANISTTARYDRRGEEAKRKAAGMLHVPYTKRVLSEHRRE